MNILFSGKTDEVIKVKIDFIIFSFILAFSLFPKGIFINLIQLKQ